MLKLSSFIWWMQIGRVLKSIKRNSAHKVIVSEMLGKLIFFACWRCFISPCDLEELRPWGKEKLFTSQNFLISKVIFTISMHLHGPLFLCQTNISLWVYSVLIYLLIALFVKTWFSVLKKYKSNNFFMKLSIVNRFWNILFFYFWKIRWYGFVMSIYV